MFALDLFVGISFVATGYESCGIMDESEPVGEGQTKLIDSFVKAFKEGDAERCAKLYTEDSVYMEAELPIALGWNVVLPNYP